jgi:hypothetical protein
MFFLPLAMPTLLGSFGRANLNQWTTHVKSKSSCIKTDSQSASLSWGLGLLILSALSDERPCLQCTAAAGPRQCSVCRVRVPRVS